MDKMVQRAIEAAKDNVGPDTWVAMQQTDRTDAIYRELRRSEADCVTRQFVGLGNHTSRSRA